MIDPPDLRVALAYLKATACEDHEGLAVLEEHSDLLELAEGLAFIALLFIEGVCDDAAGHVDVMFRALEAAERGHQ